MNGFRLILLSLLVLGLSGCTNGSGVGSAEPIGGGGNIADLIKGYRASTAAAAKLLAAGIGFPELCNGVSSVSPAQAEAIRELAPRIAAAIAAHAADVPVSAPDVAAFGILDDKHFSHPSLARFDGAAIAIASTAFTTNEGAQYLFAHEMAHYADHTLKDWMYDPLFPPSNAAYPDSGQKKLDTFGRCLTAFAARFASPSASDPSFPLALITPYKSSTVSSHLLPNSLAVRPDGKMVIIEQETSDCVMYQLKSDGTVDTSWGGGRLVLGREPNDDQSSPQGCQGIALQPDGAAVVVLQNTTVQPWTIHVVRVNADGTLDSPFNEKSRSTIAGHPLYWIANAITVDTHKNILIAGSVFSGTDWNSHSTVFRFQLTGALDGSFGAGYGFINFDPPGIPADQLRTIAFGTGGSILTAGYSVPVVSDQSTYLMEAARLIPVTASTDYTGDSSFGQSGTTTISFGVGARPVATALAAQPDGGIVLLGLTGGTSDSSYITLVRLRADGKPDNSFGNGGKVTIDSVPQGQSYALAIQNDGKILFDGHGKTAAGYFGVVGRLKPDGSPDPTFAPGDASGIARFSLAGGNTDIANLVLLPDKRILIAGDTGTDDINGQPARAVFIKRLLGDFAL